MPAPKSVIKVKKGNVEYTDSVGRANYYIQELTRGALRDVGKYLSNLTRTRFYKEFRRKNGITFAKRKNVGGFGYWVRKRENDLLIGINVAGKYQTTPYWFGFQELGTEKQPKTAVLFNAVHDNIDKIREIEGKYLSAIEDEIAAEQLINEEETLEDAE